MSTATTRTEPLDLTPPQLARRIGVKPIKVNRWITAGELEAYDAREDATPGSKPRWRITPDAWAAFKRRRSNTATTQVKPTRRRTVPAVREWV